MTTSELRRQGRCTLAYPFVESPHVTRTRGRRIDLVVLHTMETDEVPGAAESCARWFSDPGAHVSAHYCVDADSIVQCVRDVDVAWAAPGANSDGIQIELAGRARQTRAEWADAYSTALLARAAGLVAELCLRHAIPAAWLYAADLRAGRRGLVTHQAVSEAFRRSDHSDPGADFPAQAFLGQVRARLAELPASDAPPADLKPPPPTLRRGSTGWLVRRLQTLLRQHGALPERAALDGRFGPVTEAAVRAFQDRNGLEPDGIVGPLTWRALLALEPA